LSRVQKLLRQIIVRAAQSAPVPPPGCDSDELFQIAQVRAFECARQFDSHRGARFTTYLYVYVEDALKKYLRAQARHAEHAAELLDPADAASPNPMDIVIARDLRARLERAIKSLPRDARLVCTLRFLHEAPVPKIAKTLRMNPETVKSHIRRSRILLQQMLRDEEVV
jgi:RNA polymerase sigma factor (sigma-70 family)